MVDVSIPKIELIELMRIIKTEPETMFASSVDFMFNYVKASEQYYDVVNLLSDVKVEVD